jgi:hypothetical protein
MVALASLARSTTQEYAFKVYVKHTNILMMAEKAKFSKSPASGISFPKFQS